MASRALVADASNPSYSGRRDQEDCSLKPAQANSSQDLISKIPYTKRAGRMAQGVDQAPPPKKSLLLPKKKKKNCIYTEHIQTFLSKQRIGTINAIFIALILTAIISNLEMP
jgi:hypothetical protein